MANSIKTDDAWDSLHWFEPETIQRFTYEHPLFLYGIALIPIGFFLRWLVFIRFRQKVEIAFFKQDIRWHWSSLLRFIPDALLFIVLALTIFALARPQLNDERVEQSTEGIDIMLVLDISESMKIEDFKPNRLEAAKKVAREFVEGRLQDRIGIVLFAGEAFSLSPLTTDYDLIYQFIDDVNFDLITKPGTAIGLALGVALNRMRDSEAKSKVVILLSDGDNTAGNIDPQTAAKLAKAFNIKIYTIGVGKDGLVPFGTDPFGNPQYVQNSMDETTLKNIAAECNGRYFRASNNRALKDIFRVIDRYEKTEIKENRFKDTQDYYHIYLKWALVFLLLWLFSKTTFVANPLED